MSNVDRGALDVAESIRKDEPVQMQLNKLPEGLFRQELFSGDTSETAFESAKGWKPFMVFEAGLLQREGSGEDYTLNRDSYVWTTTFNAAPAAVDVTMISMRVST